MIISVLIYHVHDGYESNCQRAMWPSLQFSSVKRSVPSLKGALVYFHVSCTCFPDIQAEVELRLIAEELGKLRLQHVNHGR